MRVPSLLHMIPTPVPDLQPAVLQGLANSRLVNWLPGLVLDTSGLTFSSASASVSAQMPASRALDNPQATTYRLCQSITVTR